MTPEDILMEAITLAVQQGDSITLRQEQCKKLNMSIEYYAFAYLTCDRVPGKRHERTH